MTMGAIKEFNLQVLERRDDLQCSIPEAIASVRRDWRLKRLYELRTMIFRMDQDTPKDAQAKVREALLAILGMMEEDAR